MAEDLTGWMTQLAREEAGPFTPSAYYGTEEDSLTFYFRDDESYAQRYNKLVTLFKSLQTGELVGCQIKGLRSIIEGGGHFSAALRVGKIDLGLFFHLLAYEQPDQQMIELGQRAKNVEVEVPTLVDV